MEQSYSQAARIECDRTFWPGWSAALRRLGLDSVAAALLEAAGPLKLLLAQFVYVGQPFLQTGQVQAFARLLEDHREAQAFASFLREEETR